MTGDHGPYVVLQGYRTFRAKTSSSLGRFDRDDSRKKSNGTVRAKKTGTIRSKSNLEVDSPIFVIYIYNKCFALQMSMISISLSTLVNVGTWIVFDA